MSSEIFSTLLLEYEQKKRKAELDLENRKEDLYNKIPRLREIENELNTYAINSAKMQMAKDMNNCMDTDVEKIELSFSLFPLPTSMVIKRLMAIDKEPERIENIATIPPTTL